MVSMIINPGSGPVENARLEHAEKNIQVFIQDIKNTGREVISYKRDTSLDTGDGRYGYQLTVEGCKRICPVEMPGIPVNEVRYMKEPGQNIWDYPRLYVDGGSWVWLFGVGVVADLEGGEDGA